MKIFNDRTKKYYQGLTAEPSAHIEMKHRMKTRWTYDRSSAKEMQDNDAELALDNLSPYLKRRCRIVA